MDKDYNKNGKDELFIDSGYAFGMLWNETYSCLNMTTKQ